MRGLIGMLLAAGCALAQEIVFPYGAVYFRKSNPPPADWERDHQTAAKTGMNIMRHWFLWGAIEVAPGKFDWSDYDRMMELEARNGIKTVIAEFVATAPEWALRKYPHARYTAHDGQQAVPGMSGSSATGSTGLCLDNDDVLKLGENFLKTLAARYKDHAAIYGYDLWNECNTSGGSVGYMQTASSAHIPNEHRGASLGRMYCYCPGTQAKFRQWLKNKYGSPEAVGKAWRRYSFASWEDVEPPRSGGPYPEWLDWIEFREDRAHELLRWRRDVIRSVDKKNRITAHGLAYSVEYLPASSANDWRAAAEVDSYGFTWVHARKGTQPWKQYHAVDMIRAASRGKPFWHSEFQGGPLWMQSEVTGRPIEDGRKPDEKDIRLWSLVSMAGGVKGILFLRWRPLLDGPLFGAFGPFAMDGSMTPRSEMAGKIARWANANPDIWKSNPVKGDIGIVFVPESERFNFAQQGNTEFYSESARGAYMAFFDGGLQPDWVHIDHIREYPLVYLPYPVMLKKETAEKLKAYVEGGGTLVSEGMPAYFGDGGTAGQKQPNFGLDRVFGAVETDADFTPDLLNNLTYQVDGMPFPGRIFKQVYKPTTGNAIGQYADGGVAVVENSPGKGRTMLIGTFPAAAYFRKPAPAAAAGMARRLMEWAGRSGRVSVSDKTVTARLHEGSGGTYLWVTNPNRAAKSVVVTVAGGSYRSGARLWGDGAVTVKGNVVELGLEQRDGTVIRLQ